MLNRSDVNLRISAIFLAVTSLFAVSCSNMFSEVEERCRREARVIVHDRTLWRAYLRGAQETHSERAAEFPETRRSIVETVPGFSWRYGSELREKPNIPEGKVVRQDFFLLLDDSRLVAQFVNFYARKEFAGRSVKSCVGNFPELFGGEVDKPDWIAIKRPFAFNLTEAIL